MSLRRYGKTNRKSRSGLEERIKQDLDSRKVKYEYESVKLKYTKLSCKHCGEPVKLATYTPDFVFKRDSDVYLLVESKGYFSSGDRTKLIAVKRDNPGINLRLLFMRDERIGKASKTRNSGWAEKHGFIYAIGESIPEGWLCQTGS